MIIDSGINLESVMAEEAVIIGPPMLLSLTLFSILPFDSLLSRLTVSGLCYETFTCVLFGLLMDYINSYSLFSFSFECIDIYMFTNFF